VTSILRDFRSAADLNSRPRRRESARIDFSHVVFGFDGRPNDSDRAVVAFAVDWLPVDRLRLHFGVLFEMYFKILPQVRKCGITVTGPGIAQSEVDLHMHAEMLRLAQVFLLASCA
jgi:hypothetical protein